MTATFNPEGSSPLTRGAPEALVRLDLEGRIIPAHAGSTRWGRLARFVRGDHPRSRGEHSTVPEDTVLDPGSSPLTRGAHRAILRRHAMWRIIPAHAGSTVVSVLRIANG